MISQSLKQVPFESLIMYPTVLGTLFIKLLSHNGISNKSAQRALFGRGQKSLFYGVKLNLGYCG